MTVKKYMITLSLSSSIFLCAMDKPDVSSVRDRIDQEILGVAPDSWGRSITASLASLKKSWSLNDQTTISDLQQIQSYVPTGSDQKEIYETLYQKHLYFYHLIEHAAQVDAKAFEAVSGSTVDKLLHQERAIGNLSPVMSSLIKQQVRPNVFERIDCSMNQQRICFNEQDIHLTPLFAKKRVNVRNGNLVTSPDGKYAKSIDDDGDSIIWDLESGSSVHIDDREIAWERIRSREEYDTYAIVDGVDKHAIFTDPHHYVLSTKISMQVCFVKEPNQEGYLMTLFKKPTRESRLCAAAFKNSRGNKDELEQLLNSETLKKVEGFPAENLRFLINKELEGLQRAKL